MRHENCTADCAPIGIDSRRGNMAGATSLTFNRIELESKDIEKLVLAAKMGQWDVVWQILGPTDRPRKAYLLNCIPSSRRWGVLHQAVYWRNADVLKRLLQYPGCDAGIKAKECTSECGPTGGKTAIEIAQAYGYSDVAVWLQNSLCTDGHEERTTFAPYNTVIERQGVGLIAITLAAFKTTFHPEPVDKGKSVSVVLEDIFKKMNLSPTMWQAVRDQVCDTLFVVNKTSSEYIKAQSTNRDEFYRAIINSYTKEETYLYDHVNTALRKQTERLYHPTAKDLAMGPYIVMYKILLLYWYNLPKESSKTFRNMLLSREHMEQYQPGQRFTWLGFVSSSVVLEKAIPFPTCDAEGEYNIMFYIDNSTPCAWQPRDIEKFAQYHERERVYPAGARFQVMGRTRDNGMTVVQLKLIS